MEKSQHNKLGRMKRRILSIFSYLYLFAGYISIFCYYAYNIKVSNAFHTIIATIFFLFIYIFINHRYIKSVVEQRMLIVFESTLLITLLIVPLAYIKEQIYPDFFYTLIGSIVESIMIFLFG